MKMRILPGMLVVFFLGVCAAPAQPIERADAAEDFELAASEPGSLGPSSTKGPFYEANEYELQGRKFIRGVANVVLSPAEIPNQMFQEAYSSSIVTGAFVGLFKGAWKGVKRIGIGTWEVLTFYHPTGNYYEPYIEPEVVFQEYLH